MVTLKKTIKKLLASLGVFTGLGASLLTWNAQSMSKIAATAPPDKVAELLKASADFSFNAAYVGSAAALFAALAIFFDD